MRQISRELGISAQLSYAPFNNDLSLKCLQEMRRV